MIFLAIRYLLEKKKQTFFTLLGVFFGTMAYVSVSGFFVGFQGYMVDQLVNNSAQIHIQARQDTLHEHQLDKIFYKDNFSHVFWASRPSGVLGYQGVQNPQEWYKGLSADPRVEAYSPLITVGGLLTISKISLSANLIGCIPSQQSKVTRIADYMVEGRFNDVASGGHRIILGDELMKRLGGAIGQYILISVGTFAPVPFKIVGRYATGNRGADLQAYGALEDIQILRRTPNRVSEIAVRLKDYTQSPYIAKNWSMIAPELTESWEQQNANILSVFKIQNALRFSMIMTVLIVAGFGIYNILNMTVNQKRQDIAILRSMGYDTFDIIALFFSQGVILGTLGAFFGVIAGYIFCRYLQTIPFMTITSANPQGHLHISLNPKIYIQACLLALFAASLASILPARAAGKLTPIDIIRSGA